MAASDQEEVCVEERIQRYSFTVAKNDGEHMTVYDTSGHQLLQKGRPSGRAAT
jgi:hypothetical protein